MSCLGFLRVADNVIQFLSGYVLERITPLLSTFFFCKANQVLHAIFTSESRTTIGRRRSGNGRKSEGRIKIGNIMIAALVAAGGGGGGVGV